MVGSIDLIVHLQIIITDRGVDDGQNGLEHPIELAKFLQEVHVSDYRKHHEQNHIHYEEVQKVLNHLSDDLDKGSYGFWELQHDRDSEDEATNWNRKEVLELVINVFFKVGHNPVFVLDLTQISIGIEVPLNVVYEEVEDINAADCQNQVRDMKYLGDLVPSTQSLGHKEVHDVLKEKWEVENGEDSNDLERLIKAGRIIFDRFENVITLIE